MEGTDRRSRTGPTQTRPERDTRRSDTQVDSGAQAGHVPRLSKVNLFTLLSLWMELFPQEQHEEEAQGQVRKMGLVVVRAGKVLGLHCSGTELHAGQAAIVQHSACLSDCQLYFSRRPCATCLKMIINAGVSQISFWPGDPEVSMLRSSPSPNQSQASPESISEEAALDASATEILKSNSRSHICVLLQPPVQGLARFVDQTSQECDFMDRVTYDEPGRNLEELFSRERVRHLEDFSRHFLVEAPQHRELLTMMGLGNFCAEPLFSGLRNNMQELVGILAAVAAGIPEQYGFYREQHPAPELPSTSLLPHHEGLSQDVARHCIIQARLLAYRTEDPKVGVGAVIWARGQSASSDGTGRLYLVGCGYNAYPAGSLNGEYPQMDTKQEDPQRRKYRFIIHAEQNAFTFRTRPIKPEDTTMMFVTKCPCDECVPLISGAGIKHLYTTDQDRDKHKGDISYLRFSHLKNVSKFIWQRSPPAGSPSSSHLANGCVRKHSRQAEQQSLNNKRLCTSKLHPPPTDS